MSDYHKAVIVWLDENIHRSEYCQLLKKALAKTFIPAWDRATFLNDDAVNMYALNDFSRSSYSFEGKIIELYVYNNEEDCIQCIENNKEERIFFIVSLSFGKRAVPQIVKKCPEALQKSNGCGFRSVYVFRHNGSTIDQLWTARYTEYLLFFPCENDLVKKLINDIGLYFISLGKKQYELETSVSIHQSLEYFDWAKTLFGRVFRGVDEWQCKENTRLLNKEIAQAQAALYDRSRTTEIERLNFSSASADESQVHIREPYEQIALSTTSHPTLVQPIHAQNDHLMIESDSNMSFSDNKKLPDDEQSGFEVPIYLQQPSVQTDNFKNLQSILNHLFDENLVISSKDEHSPILFQANDSPIMIECLTDDDDNLVFETICSPSNSISLYLLGAEPDNVDARKDFFTKHPQVCAIMDNPKELATKVALHVALKSRIMGDRYAQNKDKERANRMYDQCIGLLKRLNALSLQRVDHNN